MEDLKNGRKSFIDSIVTLYKLSIKNIPLLKYSWVLITTICVLALTGYFKLKSSDVFIYAIGILLLSLLGHVLSLLLNPKDKILKRALYILVYTVLVGIVILILSFSSFIINEKPIFFKRYFSESYKGVLQISKIQIDTTQNSTEYCALDFRVVNTSRLDVIINSVNFKALKVHHTGLMMAPPTFNYSAKYDCDISSLRKDRDSVEYGLAQVILPGKADRFEIKLYTDPMQYGEVLLWQLKIILNTSIGEVIYPETINVVIPLNFRKVKRILNKIEPIK